jgi:serine kinase of HPr protein (carbohydrate metabolism regulator)
LSVSDAVPLIPTVHATAISVGGSGVLLIGPPGSGKSDLALRLIDRGAVLIADDRVHIAADGTLHPATALAGLIEVRAVGILPMPHISGIPAVLAIDLDGHVQRLPEPAVRTIGGLSLPCIALSAFEASAPHKVELAVAQVLPKG